MRSLAKLSVVLVWVASCGGGGGGDGGGGGGTGGLTSEALLDQLLHVTTAGSLKAFYDVNKVDTLTGSSFRERAFQVGVIDDPTGPDVYVVYDSNRLSHAGGIRRLSSGYEVVGYHDAAVSEVLGIFPLPVDVTTISPGVMVLPFTLSPGRSFQNSIPGLLDFTVYWDGPTSDVPAYPDAHKFRLTASGPHLGAAGVTVNVSATIYAVRTIGPVQGSVVRDYVASTGLLRRTTYTFVFKRFGA